MHVATIACRCIEFDVRSTTFSSRAAHTHTSIFFRISTTNQVYLNCARVLSAVDKFRVHVNSHFYMQHILFTIDNESLTIQLINFIITLLDIVWFFCSYGLLGASGCGKTTLLSCIVGRRRLNSGEIWVLGGTPGSPGSGVPGPRIGYMPQVHFSRWESILMRKFTLKNCLFRSGTCSLRRIHVAGDINILRLDSRHEHQRSRGENWFPYKIIAIAKHYTLREELERWPAAANELGCCTDSW